MKKNVFYEAYHYILHVVKIFLGCNSYYYMRNHKRQKLTDRIKTQMNHHGISDLKKDTSKTDSKYTYTTHLHQ